MSIQDFKDIGTMLTALAGVLGAILGVIKYFSYRSQKDKIEAVGKGFAHVVDSLGSNDEIKRRAAAILLRRFFDPTTEFGKAGTPYADEAVNVIAAILREERSGSFQKLLADGLWYARSLKHADLQKTNLQNAYLGAKGDQGIDLSGADFYRADLSGASLKGARARRAVFYQSRLVHTVFTQADLTKAIFFEADLQGARFEKATLSGADFSGARNVSPEVVIHLDENGKYLDEPVGEHHSHWPKEPSIRVFLSRPAVIQPQWLSLIEGLHYRLGKIGALQFVELARKDYPHFGALSEIRRVISGCSGVVVVGIGELEIQAATWRAGTPEETFIENEMCPTPWVNIEAGIAVGLNLPVLIVAQPNIRTGIFDEDSDDHNLHRVTVDTDTSISEINSTLVDWYAAVRERGRG